MQTITHKHAVSRRGAVRTFLGLLAGAGLAVSALCTTVVHAAEIRVVTSGGFSAAYDQLIPLYEQATGHKVITSRGASIGNAPDSIPSRLARGEQFDIVILADSALDQFIQQGKVKAGSIKRSQLSEIATMKMKDLNANDIDAATKIIEGSARAMGLEVVEG